MKDKAFVEKGLGMLHLKKVEGDDTKTQMVVRAETNLGKIYLLCNGGFFSESEVRFSNFTISPQKIFQKKLS